MGSLKQLLVKQNFAILCEEYDCQNHDDGDNGDDDDGAGAGSGAGDAGGDDHNDNVNDDYDYGDYDWQEGQCFYGKSLALRRR